jgi:hypothetical protein
MIKSRRLRWAGHAARKGEKRNAYTTSVRKPEGKRQLGRPMRRWKDNIKMDLRETGWGGIICIDLVRDRDQQRALVNTVMNLRVPLNVGIFLSCCETGGFPRRAPIHGVSPFIP